MKSKILLSASFISLTMIAMGQKDPKATEVWEPEPKIVTPGATPSEAPSDAIILFNGKNLDEWSVADKPDKPAGWTLNADGSMTVKKGTGTIQTKR
ncbi:MAG: DUF1080 domain-containing protein, partial [Chitinophagaceae bacterium]|nr:DUF1080 domain-containing protein [Chitinophagaceae bacterium]